MRRSNGCPGFLYRKLCPGQYAWYLKKNPAGLDRRGLISGRMLTDKHATAASQVDEPLQSMPLG